MRLNPIKVVAIGALAALVTTSLSSCALLPDQSAAASSKDCSASALIAAVPLHNTLLEPFKVQKDAQEKCPWEMTEAELLAALDIDPDEIYSGPYPERFTKLLEDNGYKIETIEGQGIPVLIAGTKQRVEDKIATNAILAPLKDQSKEEVMAHVLAEPDYAGQIISGLYRTPIGNTTLGAMTNNSKWMPAWTDPAVIDDWAELAIASDDATRLLAAKKTSLAVYILEVLFEAGIQDDTARWHFSLVFEESGGVLDINQAGPEEDIAEFQLNTTPYKGTFLVLEVRDKEKTGCKLRIGINVDDGRYAYLGCPPSKPRCVTKCKPPCPPTVCLPGKTGGVPAPGMDDTRDSGTGTKPPATDDGGSDTPPVVVTTPTPQPTPTQTPEAGGGGGNGTVSD